jgi:hypothetical protein
MQYISQIMRLLVVASLLLTSFTVQADFGAVLFSPVNQQRHNLSSFSWEIPAAEAGYPERASVIDLFKLKMGRTAPQQGPATLIVSKPVEIDIVGISDYCGTDKVIPSIHIEIPIWGERFPTDQRYYQRYSLEDVVISRCERSGGAQADALWLSFKHIIIKNEPRPLPF